MIVIVATPIVSFWFVSASIAAKEAYLKWKLMVYA